MVLDETKERQIFHSNLKYGFGSRWDAWLARARLAEQEIAKLHRWLERIQTLVDHEDRFQDGIDWVQRAMQAEIELEEAKKDAARYRWLRGHDWWQEKRLDDHIDAAIAEANGCQNGVKR